MPILHPASVDTPHATRVRPLLEGALFTGLVLMIGCAEIGDDSGATVAMAMSPGPTGGVTPVSPNAGPETDTNPATATAADSTPAGDTNPPGSNNGSGTTGGGSLPPPAGTSDTSSNMPSNGETVAVTQECTTEADCSLGQACVTSASSGSSRCVDTCSTDSDCPGSGARCISTSNDPTESVLFCTRPCDPLSNSGCSIGEACEVYAVNPDGSDLYATCRPDGNLPAGSPCDTDQPDACQAGTTCASGMTSTGEVFQNCLMRCSVEEVICDDGSPCLPNSPPAILNGLEIGLCL